MSKGEAISKDNKEQFGVTWKVRRNFWSKEKKDSE